MGEINSFAATYLRKYATDGVQASGNNNPAKSDGRAVFASIDSQVTALQNAQAAGGVSAATLAELNSDFLDFAAGTPGSVRADLVGTPNTRSRSANIATIGFGSAHGVSVGESVNVRNMPVTSYNAEVALVTAVTGSPNFTISYASTGSNETALTANSGGTVNKNGYYQKQGASGSGSWLMLSSVTDEEQDVRIQALEDDKAPLESPSLTGVPSAPTAAIGTNTTQIATMAAVKAAVDALLGGAPGALDTLNELATALGDDAAFATTVTNAIALKAPLASPALTGTPTAPTAAIDTNTTQIATMAAVKAGDDLRIKKDGTVAFTGDQSLGTHKLTNVTDPASAQDAATKNYVDGWSVIMSGAVIVDIKTFVVRYPSMVLVKNGVTVQTVAAADYSLAYLSGPINVSSSITEFHYIDVSAIGGASTPIKSSSGGTAPVGGPNNVPLGSIYNGIYTSYCGAVAVGDGQPNQKVNVYNFSSAIDSAGPSAVAQGTIDDCTNASMIALGLTRGIKDTVGLFPQWEADIAVQNHSQMVFVRIFVQSAEANFFGTPQVTLCSEANTFGTTNLVLEQKISSTVASYSAAFRLTNAATARNIFLRVGTDGTASGHGSADLHISGLQIGADDGDTYWVPRADLFNSSSLVSRIGDAAIAVGAVPVKFRMSPKLFMTVGRPVRLYWDNIIYDKTMGGGFAGGFSSINGDKAYEVPGFPSLEIDPDRCGSTGTLTVRPLHGPNQDYRFELPITIYKAPATGTGSPIVLCIGDSLTYGVVTNLVKARLTAMGLTPNFIGTQDDTTTGGVTAKTEARSGAKYSDYTYERTDVVSPVTVGGEATYLALSDVDKKAFNPFLKTPGTDPFDSTSDTSARAGFIYNSYIFDMYFYLNRFSFPTPNIVTVELGTNDPEGSNYVEHGVDVLYSQIRRQLPNAHIAFFVTATPRGDLADGYYTRHRRDSIIYNQMTYVLGKRNGGDTKVWWLNTNAHQSPNTGWLGFTTVATDSLLGTKTQKIAVDFLHPNSSSVPMYQDAEIRASFIAAYAAGLL